MSAASVKVGFEAGDESGEGSVISQRLGRTAEAKLPLLSGMRQELEIFGPEDLGERLDREQEAFLRRAPRLPVRRQAATGDQAMHMDMLATTVTIP